MPFPSQNMLGMQGAGVEYFDFWTVVTASAYTYTMTIAGTNGEKIYIDWGDGGKDSYTFIGSNQFITHEYNAGTFQQRWAVNMLDVLRLTAESQRLSGELPLEIQDSTDIIVLNVESNALTSDLGINGWPAAIGGFTSLGSLFLGNNTFIGDLSTWDLSNLLSIGSIRLFNNGFNGDISGWGSWLSIISPIFIFCQDNNFTGDISVWDFNPDIRYVNFSGSPITGYIDDIGQGGMTGLAQFRFLNCDLTGLNDNTDIIFTNRASYTSTSKSVWIDDNNELIKGTYQQPDLGTYGGDINDLTETEIDNLAAGTDYDGLGTNILWSINEKIWILENLDTTSTSGVLRYAFTFTYDQGLSTVQVTNSGALGLPGVTDFVDTNTDGLADNWVESTPGSFTTTIETGDGFIAEYQKLVKLTAGTTFLYNNLFTVVNGATYVLSINYIHDHIPTTSLLRIEIWNSTTLLATFTDIPENLTPAIVWQSDSFVADDTQLQIKIYPSTSSLTGTVVGFDELELIRIS